MATKHRLAIFYTLNQTWKRFYDIFLKCIFDNLQTIKRQKYYIFQYMRIPNLEIYLTLSCDRWAIKLESLSAPKSTTESIKAYFIWMHILIFCAQYFKFHCGVWFSVVCKDGNIVQNNVISKHQYYKSFYLDLLQ